MPSGQTDTRGSMRRAENTKRRTPERPGTYIPQTTVSAGVLRAFSIIFEKPGLPGFFSAKNF